MKEEGMQLCKFKGSNISIDGKEILRLENEVIVCWKASMKDRLKILFTGRIWSGVLCGKDPSQQMWVVTKRPFTFKKGERK
jgi:hypothetical protein